MKPANAGPVSAHDFLLAIYRHKRVAMIVFLAVVTLVAMVTFLLPKTYQSEGKFLVRLGRENATLDPTAAPGQEPVVALPASRDNEINSIVEVLQSHTLLGRVVDALGTEVILGAPPPQGPDGDATQQPSARDRDRAVRQMARDLEVTPGKKSNLVHVTCKAASPELAQRILAKLLEVFQDEHIRLNRQTGALEFFAKQVERSQAELSRKEAELRDVKTAAGVVVLAEQQQLVAKRLGRLQDDLADAETARAVAERKVEALRKQLAALPPTHLASTTGGHDATDRMREQLYALQIKREDAAARYAPDHPELQQIESQLAAAKAIFDRQENTRTQISEGPNRLFEEARLALVTEEAGLASLGTRIEVLGEKLAAVRQELKTLNQSEPRITRLQRDVDLQQANCRKYAAALEQARTDQALDARRMSNISIVEEATFDPRAVHPHTATNLALGAAAGLCFGLAAAMFCEWRKRPPSPWSDRAPELGSSAQAAASYEDELELAFEGYGRD